MSLGLAILFVSALALAAQAPTADRTAPATFTVAFHTTNGDFAVLVHRDWAPHGADRFYTLVQSGYYQGDAFYRVVPHFVAQWGLNPSPAVSAAWAQRRLPDDPVKQSNLRGRVSFAASGPNSRTTQVFVNLADHPQLDRQGFAPLGEVVSGWAVVASLAADYGEVAPAGRGPDPRRILTQGAAYLTRFFPRLDVIYSAFISAGPSAAAPRAPLTRKRVRGPVVPQPRLRVAGAAILAAGKAARPPQGVLP